MDKFEAQEPEQHKSKSQLKQEMQQLQSLGARLLELKPEQLAQIPISEDLRQAVDEARRIKQHEAKRRHLQYIGKLMREEDAQAIAAKLAKYDSSSSVFKKMLHQAERWRDELLDNESVALTEILNQHPNIEVQPLRQLVRAARKERQQGKPPSYQRKLFRFLRDMIEQA